MLFRREQSFEQRAITAVAERTGAGQFQDVSFCSDANGGGYVTLWYVPPKGADIASKFPFPVFFLVEFKGGAERVYLDRNIAADFLTQLRAIKAQAGNAFIDCNDLYFKARDVADGLAAS